MSNNDNIHPSTRTNAALVALAQVVQSGKACSVPLAMESGYAVLQKEDNLTRYTLAQASRMLAICRQQAIGATSRYSEAGKIIREARSASIIAETGGYVCEGVDGVFHSQRAARKAGLQATYGADWWKRDDVADLRKEWSSKVHKAGEAPATPAPVAEAPTATVMDAQVITVAQALGSKATTEAGARKFLAARGINL
jgi:hypothetical protein